ncbi:MAG: dephospho-CoA kinase [Bacteroidales bacterium]|jgi:dephospho-CoA kinase|nr:dephospho-CoA kinase [Bacteroidales bacterium]MDD2264556.1 dephospho-CoA kinase [Bacteroidales bacterium]MDD2831791.1 dephospho-CoA kinase [Bacteroidales bacterium]MDD3209316.1 dephospho-CoA kinase [Bacteroidales bacterium]MDD3697759.1 dephospho-CoA kinase [Bacteroidales bacterium]
MITLGITGGIGSGKSYVTRIFSALGIPYYDSDARTKQLYRDDPDLKEILTGLFGPDIYRDEKPDIRKMALLIFSNQQLLKKVNMLVHPYVVRDFMKWASSAKAPYVIFESAILLEMDPPFHTTRVLTVSANRELRLWRAAGRDNAHLQSVLDRMNKQWTDAQREAHADFVIVSDDKQPLLPRVLQVHQYMMNLTNNHNEN